MTIDRNGITVTALSVVTVFVLLTLSQCQATRSSPGPSTALAGAIDGPTVSPPTGGTNASSTPTVSASVTPGGAPPISTTPGSEDESPIIIATVDFQDSRGGKAVISLRCLNDSGYDRKIEVEETWDLGMAAMDDRANIYLPVWRLNKADVLYVVPRHDAIKRIVLQTKESYTSQFLDGRMVLAGSGSWDSITIVDEDFSHRTIHTGMSGGLPSLIEGKNNTVIYLDGEPVVQDGKHFARAMIVDLNSGDVVERLLPAPELEGVSLGSSLPGERYGSIFIGASPDLKRLYYSYLAVDKAGDNVFYTRLGMFDTEKEEDLPYVYDGCCPPMGGYLQYRDYLMVSHFPEAGGSALLLHMKDLSPVVDLPQLLKGGGETSGLFLVRPFGEYFLVGTDSRVLLLSQDGALLKEYPLPPELIGKEYTIVEYRGKAGAPLLDQAAPSLPVTASP